MFFSSSEFSQELSETLQSQELTSSFLADSMDTEEDHFMVLLFSGENAVAKISAIVGNDLEEENHGSTLRDTYGDHFLIETEEMEGDIFYFEPGAIAPTTEQEAKEGLAVLAKFSSSQGGILDESESFGEDVAIEKSLVLIKPDNFTFSNIRPGAIIDLLTSTGLALVGCKVQHMSVAQAMEFYGPVLEVLERKLPDGRIHWESIIAFMSGKRPSELEEHLHAHPGTAPCLALIYQGPEAISKIRTVLGPTDPSKAGYGTIRKEFGQDIMVNAAHASDAPESVLRETAIIKIDEDNFKSVIEKNLSH